MSTSRPLKRKKTSRACDYCRAHRIRCEYLEGTVCKHCLEYGLTCEQVAAAPPDARRQRQSESMGEDQGLEPTYLGPSSLEQLVWSHLADWQRFRIEGIDSEYDHHRNAFQGDGGLLVGREVEENWNHSRTRGPSIVTFSDVQAVLVRQIGSAAVLDDLLGICQTRILPVFPVLSVTESVGPEGPRAVHRQYFNQHAVDSTPPTALPSVARLITYALPAMSRSTPREVRLCILNTLQRSICSTQFVKLERTSSLAIVQLLLILSMSTYDTSASAFTEAWKRCGSATRSAMELGLHRKVSSAVVPRGQAHRRQRVWGACIAADRWLATCTGLAISIDLKECDAPLPFIYPDHCPDGSTELAPCFSFLREFVRLSILLGRAHRIARSPTPWNDIDDLVLYRFQADLDEWKAGLPVSWPYDLDFETPEAADLMNLFYVAVEFTFLSAFIWTEIPKPPHIKFAPSLDRLPNLLLSTTRAIQWAESEAGKFYLDVWSWTVYPLVCCAIVNFRNYLNTFSVESFQNLDVANRCILEWSTALGGDAPPSRRKIARLVQVMRDAVEVDIV